MTSKKNKLDLLVRVRYANPLPAPPCPPKLLDIPTNPTRYSRPEFLDALAQDIPLPMIVDAECGMPLDLGKWESLWLEPPRDGESKSEIQGHGSELNPDPNDLPSLDPEDAALLADIAPSHSFGSAHSSAGPSNSLPAHVSWLRRTEYITRESTSRVNLTEPKAIPVAVIDVSPEAQLRTIEASFAAANNQFNLESLVHPNKPGVRAVASYEVLPDDDIWANQYDLFRFSERPGERPSDVDDPRLDCAILRPMKTEHDSFLAYYLTQDDEMAERLKETRRTHEPYEVPADGQETIFSFVRDYETVKVEQEVPNEFLLVLEDGGENDISDGISANHRQPGAYFKGIERKMVLKKKRVNPYDSYADKWEVIRMTHVAMGEDEVGERQDLLAEVQEPEYFLRQLANAGKEEMDMDGDAEGEMDMNG
ncbi:unnamed protein product [Mycena citricolor]|uniref:RNA polymerase II-associated protein n=1 Tax=Mycena citricolor TaxID=2018698 RepID=A0AAD2H4V0_9AGAR|nr:unnamed protein product [Mycena citricolor]